MTALLARAVSLVRNLMRRDRIEREMDAELRGYVDMLADEKVASGMDPVKAGREARIQVGGVDQVKEQIRAVRAGALFEQLAQDVRYAVRGLRRAPIFALTTAATLALGIGANTAMFSVIDALLLRPLPVYEPERVFAVYRGPTSGTFSFPDLRAVTTQTSVLSGVAAWGSQSTWLQTSAGFDRIVLDTVSPNYFALLGVAPQIGTSFVTTDETASRGMVVISDRLWRTRFGADPSVVGRAITLGGQSMTIAGVAPRAFIGLQPASPTEAWTTFATLSMLEPGWDFQAKEEIWIRLIARLRDDVDARTANAAVAHIASRGGPPALAQTALRLVPASTPIFDPDARSSASRLAMLVAAVAGLVLLIACANVANLLIVRGNARRREIGMRLALGASRARIARQMITEALVLAAAGCVVGLPVAYWTLRVVIALAPPSAIPPGIVIDLDARVIAFGALLALATALAFGVTPAWQLTRMDLLPVVKDAPGAEPTSARGPLRLRRMLVITQVALSAVLLVGAVLFVRTLSAALAVAPGYDIDHVLLVSTDFGVAKLTPAETRDSGRRILERVATTPGVQSAAFGQIVPFSGAFVSRPAVPEGQAFTTAREDQYLVPYAVVSPGYFNTLGMRLTGRDFSSTDTESAPRVVVVNETLARKYWPGRNAVGQRLTLPLKDPGPSYEVIGVVADGKYVALTEPQHPYMYVPWQQMHRPRMTLHVRTTGDPMAIAMDVRARIASVNREVPAYNPVSLATYVDRSIAQQRIVARLLVLFGAVALAVATVGVYGLTAFTVTRRAKEFGVRVALGAQPRDIVRMLVTQSAVLIAAGLIAGTAATLFLTRLVETLLFGVTPADPLSFAGGAALLAMATMAATIVPALRATRVDPLAVLRAE